MRDVCRTREELVNHEPRSRKCKLKCYVKPKKDSTAPLLTPGYNQPNYPGRGYNYRGIIVYNICLISINNSFSNGATNISLLNIERPQYD